MRKTITLYQFFTILRTLKELLLAQLRLVFALEPRLDRFVLSIKVAHVWHQILDNIHVRKGVNLCCLVHIGINFAVDVNTLKLLRILQYCTICLSIPNASERVATTNIHGTRAADAFSAGTSESQSGVHLIFYFDQSV